MIHIHTIYKPSIHTPSCYTSSVNEAYGAASFSQAFESIEDSKHFKKTDNASSRERVDQRAFEAASVVGDAAEALGQGLSDRDHHAILEPHVLNVSTKQRGNNVLQFVRNVPYKFARMASFEAVSSLYTLPINLLVLPVPYAASSLFKQLAAFLSS